MRVVHLGCAVVHGLGVAVDLGLVLVCRARTRVVCVDRLAVGLLGADVRGVLALLRRALPLAARLRHALIIEVHRHPAGCPIDLSGNRARG